MGDQPRILVVDDDDAVAHLLTRLLERHGYSCEVAGRGQAARLLLEAETFGLVLCDVHLPGESGLDLARHVAAHHPGVTMIMVSGLDDPLLVEHALEAGAAAYLTKPLRFADVLAAIERVIGPPGD